MKGLKDHVGSPLLEGIVVLQEMHMSLLCTPYITQHCTTGVQICNVHVCVAVFLCLYACVHVTTYANTQEHA